MGKALDLTGQRFGKLVAVRPTEKRVRRQVVWECKCDCGKICYVPSRNLTSGGTKSCGHLRNRNLAGRRFGKLTAIKETDKRKNGRVVWECRCDCGNTCQVDENSLVFGGTKSCGCLHTANIAGQRFGKLVVIKPTEERKNGSIVWECKCDCGSICSIPSKSLKSGKVKSCGCLRTLNIAGQRFGKLVAVRPTNQKNSRGIVWECKCDCGNICFVAANSLVGGNTKSCGCNHKYVKCKRLHTVWQGMRNRCESPRHDSYHLYGGKGVSVCDEWKYYPNFEKWALENGYDPDAERYGCTIDRIDSNGNYCPENCRFISMKAQNRNRKSNVPVIGSDGSKYGTMTELAEKVGITRYLLHRFIDNGTPIDGVVYRFSDQD